MGNISAVRICRVSGLLLCLSFALSGCKGESQTISAVTPSLDQAGLSQAKQCVYASPLLDYGKGAQKPLMAASSAMAIQQENKPREGACAKNRAFRFGAGRADITGPSGGKILMGNENIDNYATGIQGRLFARAFVVGSPCNQKRTLMVLTDTGMIFGAVRDAVLARIQSDPELKPFYGNENLMLSATHTHSGPGGYSHYEAYNFFRLGFDEQSFNAIVDGIVRALGQAHSHYENATATGPIRIAQGELLGANVSRAPEVYRANPALERALYRDTAGEDVDTNRLMTLLRFTRDDGKEVGSVNWFAVHPTSDNLIGQFGEPISGDNKGYAMYSWERMMKSEQEPFVSSFQQSDSGDAFSYLWHRLPEEQARRYPKLLADAHQGERHPLTVANGLAQLSQALRLFDAADEPLTGEVDHRMSYVRMDQTVVTDPVVLASLRHPPALDAVVKETCNPSLGYSFLAGGRGAAPGELGKNARMGVSCQNSADTVDALMGDLEAVMAGKVPAESLAYAVGCQASRMTALNLQCQAEKPVFLLFGPPVNVSPTVLPFQLLRIGNLAIVGIPWEVTTMAGRRIRQTVLEVLKSDGVTDVVVNALSNDFVNYLTTREEYAVQGYEGASNQFGPWTLAVVQQELRRLALAMRDGLPVDPGPKPPRKEPTLRQLAPFNVVDIAPPNAPFGALVQDVKASYTQGDVVTAIFHSADPNNDLLTEDSFLAVEKQQGPDQWVVVATDRDPETTFLWRTAQPRPQFLPSPVSQAEIIWRIPRNAEPGIYRLRHQGVAMALGQTAPSRFAGVSSPFTLSGAGAVCP